MGSRTARSDDSSDKNQSAGSRFDVLGRAGEGLAFVVYKVRERTDGARDRTTSRTYALKALKAAFGRNPRFAPPMQAIAQRVREIDHPNVARVLETGEEDGTPFVVTEWLPGGSLEDRLRRAPLDIEETRALAIALGRGLDALHQAGIAHGDLRPRQILFSSGGTPKLTDAGLDAAFAATGTAIAEVQQDAAYYLAPERGLNSLASPPADLYALGAILYRMATGRVPFEGPSPLSIANRHRKDEPLAPSELNPDCPAWLEAVILRLLSKSPANRYPSVQELLRDLEPNAAPPLSGVAPGPAAADVAGAVTPARTADDAGADADAPPRKRRSTLPAPMVTQLDEPTARKKQRRREFWGFFLAVFWLLVACGLLGGIFYGAYYFWRQDTPKEVSVPDYRNRATGEADRLLHSRGLKMVVTSEVYDKKRPADTIIKGDPPPGKKVRAGREVYVTVSRGDEPMKMVDLTELDLSRARQILARSGVKIGQISYQYHDSVPKGYICGQYPEAGESFARSEPINLVVSRGPEPKDVTGDGEELPPPPEPEDLPEAPPLEDPNQPTNNFEPPPTNQMVSRKVAVRVAIPANGEAQEVRVDVTDRDGEHTVYKAMHAPGDLVDESVTVRREQGTKAIVRIYVNGELLREQTV